MPFVTPENQEFVNTFGIETTSVGEYQYRLDFSEVVDGELEFSYNVVGRSVAVSWRPVPGRGGFSIFHEGATVLRIADSAESSKLVVDFSTEDTTGSLEVQVFPYVSVSDRTLIC
ncbi:hypothetical protein [Streptomyces sp. NPDC096033]|uniref:hypothetical protein n=1 Tax=Streptomyces sp. NPDC096033 TaxID=3366071 RepID=UPI00382DF84D